MRQNIINKITLLLSISYLLVSCSAGGSSSNNSTSCTTDYFVATTGDDAADGFTKSTPFKTINKAKLAIAKSKDRGQCAINVNIKNGTYTLTEPLIFTSNDSGNTNARITYQAQNDNTAPVIISGGIPVTNFQCSNAMCSAKVESLPDGIMPRQFYVAESRAIRARSNYGESVNYDYIREPQGYLQIIPQSFTHPELVEAVTATQWKMMRCPVAAMSGPSLIMQNPCWNNANTYPSPWNFQLLSWLENAKEFVTVPNMWYLDPYTKEITYYNTQANLPTDAVLPVLESLVVLQGNPGNSVHDISFKGLQFSYATWLLPNTNNGYVSDQSSNILIGSGYESNTIGHQKVVYKTLANIEMQYAKNIYFIDNTFSHLGGIALDLGTGSQNNQILNNTFTDISSSAIEVGGVAPENMRPDANQVTSNNLIKNNTISYTGRDYYDSAGIYVGFTTGTIITHNDISHVPWSGIAIGWGWGLFDQGGFPGLVHATPNMWGNYDSPTATSNNQITSNKMDYFLEQLWDGGSVYTNGAQGPDFTNGLLLKLNVVSHKRPGAGSNIFYTDGGSKYVTLTQNVSLDDPVGVIDFGPCNALSSIFPECLANGVSYGADMGGCLPVGYLTFTENYLADPLQFFGPNLCKNSNIPPYPVNMTFVGNVPTTSSSQVPQWILDQAGVEKSAKTMKK